MTDDEAARAPATTHQAPDQTSAPATVQTANAATLVLASASPRRRELLERLGIRVDVHPADIDESPRAGEAPGDYVRRVAREKCNATHDRLGDARAGRAVLAADTSVIAGGAILGKPADADEAGAMLDRLAGRRHDVVTAYCLRRGDTIIERALTTQVTFRLLDPAERAAYIACGEWQGKAGGYAVQGIASAFVTDVRGSITNVIGLPLAEVIADLRAMEALPHYPAPAFGVREA